MSNYGLYRVGYSFENPRVVSAATRVRSGPFFGFEWAEKGPTQVKEDLYRSGKLARYSPVWRRSAKSRTTEKIDVRKSEVPSFSELGQAPSPTSNEPSASRNIWGFLDSIVKVAGNVVSERQQMELMRVQAQTRPIAPSGIPGFVSDGGIGTTTTILIVAGIGVGAYLLMRRR